VLAIVDGRAAKKAVVPGIRGDSLVEIRDGVVEGDRLIPATSGVVPGQRVRVVASREGTS
jgi:HlyD family secretion protein